MSHPKLKSLVRWSGLAFLALLGLLLGLRIPATGAEPTAAGVTTYSLSNSIPVTISVPLVAKGYPSPPPVFGVQMSAIDEAHGLSKAVDANVHWVRYQAFAWDLIEPVRTEPPTYYWSAVDEAGLRNAYQRGMTVIATVQYAPEWAQEEPGSVCGPIHADRLDEYAQFLSALVKRYRPLPYMVRYWELGNEPDAPILMERAVFGCWGREGDRYYGGAAYGQMLRQAYPAIKAADPLAQVLIGGLLLECDPTQPPPGKDCASGRFLEGILSAGAGSSFDMVSFHGYALYNGSIDQDEQHPYWGHRGGVVLGKAAYLREVLGDHNLDKPLVHTEGSLICPAENPIHCNPTPKPSFFQKQAEYAVWLYTRNWAEGIVSTIWYQFDGPGWRYSGMLDENQAPRPVYTAFDFMTEALGGARYEGPVTDYSQIKGYSFVTPAKRVWVLLPPDGTVWNIALPGDVTRVYDALGADITPPGSNITLTGPIYVERAP